MNELYKALNFANSDGTSAALGEKGLSRWMDAAMQMIMYGVHANRKADTMAYVWRNTIFSICADCDETAVLATCQKGMVADVVGCALTWFAINARQSSIMTPASVATPSKVF